MNISKVKSESALMHFFKSLGMDSIAWSLRRIHCPVNKEDLVLEVGSGGSPYFRANILCDAFEDTEERYFAPLIKDRPTIIAFAEKLPFKNDSFDHVIASHVLEHSTDPDIFLSELQRVAKSGYIEVPDAFMERLTNYRFHRLEISENKDQLIIKKKKNFIEDEELYSLFTAKASTIFPKWMEKYPFQFHVRYYWTKKDGIKYSIDNPEIDCNWPLPKTKHGNSQEIKTLKSQTKKIVLSLIRSVFSQNRRNKSLDLKKILMCSECHNDDLEIEKDAASCSKCGKSYKIFLP